MSILQNILKSSFFNGDFYIDKLKYQSAITWLFTSLVMILGLRYFKNAIAFVLIKLYEMFIMRTSN